MGQAGAPARGRRCVAVCGGRCDGASRPLPLGGETCGLARWLRLLLTCTLHPLTQGGQGRWARTRGTFVLQPAPDRSPPAALPVPTWVRRLEGSPQAMVFATLLGLSSMNPLSTLEESAMTATCRRQACGFFSRPAASRTRVSATR